MASGDLYALANEYLLAVVGALALSPGGPVSRTFISPGAPAFDCCDMACVHVGGALVADTAPVSPPLVSGQRIEDTGRVLMLALTATVLRCVPSLDEGGSLPPAAEITATAETTFGDLWTIWNHVSTLKRNGSLWGPDTRELVFDPAFPVNIEGGCAGWQIPLRVQLGGYRTL